jgi:hypothetical protein
VLDGEDVAWHWGRRHVGRAGNMEDLVAMAQAPCVVLARTMNSSARKRERERERERERDRVY